MTILHISDTHNSHKELGKLPEADVIVHSGDFTRAGTETEAYDFMDWLCDLPYKHKIFIAGNHDTCMFGAKSRYESSGGRSYNPKINGRF